jgi:REP element-mobilizing transposase RayT
MPRNPRCDFPGAWHHVLNRGIARRTLFENELDIRTFLSRLALRVRSGQLELHSFCVLTTHFHLLLRSPKGELSEAMCEVQREYSRWFNRTRRRDGPLFRGRFVSKLVEDLEYREQLVRYIDFNPVQAGLVARPALYPYGSARAYAGDRGPIWLCRDWIEAVVRRRAHEDRYEPSCYARVFGEVLPAELEGLIEQRLLLQNPKEDPLLHLVGAAHGEVLDWMQAKARLADGMPVGAPVCAPEILEEVVRGARDRGGNWLVRANRKSADG